jgi:hypothetical protein
VYAFSHSGRKKQRTFEEGRSFAFAKGEAMDRPWVEPQRSTPLIASFTPFPSWKGGSRPDGGAFLLAILTPFPSPSPLGTGMGKGFHSLSTHRKVTWGPGDISSHCLASTITPS